MERKNFKKQETIQLQISGMHCASCVKVSARALKKVPGVIDATVNYATEKANVTFDAKQVDKKKIIPLLQKAVENRGYEATLKRISKKNKQQKCVYLNSNF